MDWFEKLTSFRETDYDDTRAKLKVEDSRLRSLVNGKDYGIGELELVPLQSLRERVKSAGGLPGRLKVSVVTGDVRHMHRSPENAGASQFNLLRWYSHGDTGARRYPLPTRPYSGPACDGWRSHHLPAFRAGRWQQRQTTERRRVSRPGKPGSRLESARQGTLGHEKRLRVVYPRRS